MLSMTHPAVRAAPLMTKPTDAGHAAMLQGMVGLIEAMKCRPLGPAEAEVASGSMLPPSHGVQDELVEAARRALELPALDGGHHPPSALERGDVVGRHVVLQKLGAGGMGVVYAAYDPELDRKVALKLLLPGSVGSNGRTRLLREAQALGKLAHPNVVAIHDVGTVGEQVWLAMEFVQGETLGAWLKTPRRWQDVLEIMREAGKGLVAAHAAGLLHRDFKPDNVMVGDDGRVRVMDFGLARARPTEMSVDPEESQALPAVDALKQQVTMAGSIVGTPGYMAPEQICGEELTAAADQFAFCVALWEVLYAERPFGGETAMESFANVLAGRLRTPTNGRAVPGWLRRVCQRGLSVDPQQRWPSMAVLVEALTKGRVRARVRKGLAALGVLAVIGVGVEGYQRYDVMQQAAACEASGAEIETAWNPEHEHALREAFLATGVSHARTTADKVLPWIDRAAADWAEHHTLACIRTVEQRWKADTFDRASWCLEDRKLALESLVRVLSDADDTTVQRAVSIVATLEPSAPCLDEGSLERMPPPPAEQDQARIAEVRRRLATVAALWWVGDNQAGLAMIDELRSEVSELEWAPLSVRTSTLESELLESAGSFERAEAVGIAGYMQAAEAGAWGDAADQASQLAYLVGYTLARPADGRVWAQHAAVAASYASDPLGLRESQRLTDLAGVALATGSYDEAGALYERALEPVRAALGPEHLNVGRGLANIGVVAFSRGSLAEARLAFEQALAILENALGPEHPDLAIVLGNLGAVVFEEGDYPEALAIYERVFAIESATRPPTHPSLAASLDNLALVHNAMGEHERAFALQERAIALWKETVGVRHPSLALSYNNLGAIELERGRFGEAQQAYELAVELYQHSEGLQPYEHEAEFALAKLLIQTGGDRARALTLARSALDGLRALGSDKVEEVGELEAWLAETGLLASP